MIRTNTSDLSRDTIGILEARPTVSAVTPATPSSVVMSTVSRSSSVGSVSWSTSRGSTSTAPGTGLPTEVTSVRSSLCPTSIPVSYPPPAIGIPSSTGLSALAASFLYQLSGCSHRTAYTQDGSHITAASESERWVASEATRDARTPEMQTPYLLGQQLSPMNKFSGEDLDGDGETFLKWVEQFELVASMYKWNDQAKLVNLTTRLRGQVYAFYRTCTPKVCAAEG